MSSSLWPRSTTGSTVADEPQHLALGEHRGPVQARIVTAAAVLIALVFLAFSFSRVSFMQLFGFGMALAVLLDAFLIRATLVPAFMRLAGGANWWAPPILRRVHERFGISEQVDLDPHAPADEPVVVPLPV